MSVGPPTLTHLLAREPRTAASSDGPAPAQTRQWFEAEPLWFKRAIFYENAERLYGLARPAEASVSAGGR